MLANMRQCPDPSSFAAGQTRVKTLDSWSVDGGAGEIHPNYSPRTAMGRVTGTSSTPYHLQLGQLRQLDLTVPRTLL